MLIPVILRFIWSFAVALCFVTAGQKLVIARLEKRIGWSAWLLILIGSFILSFGNVFIDRLEV